MQGEGDSKRELEDSRVRLVHFFYTCKIIRPSLVAQWHRTHLTMQETKETWVQFLGQEDPLEEEMATHSSIFARIARGQRSLAGHSPGGHKELDTTE